MNKPVLCPMPVPTVQFNDLPDPIKDQPSAHAVVKGMSDDQVRYALWEHL